MPRVVASVEARMSSSRLPGKVLMDLAGRPALTRLLHRLRRSRHLDDVILATSTAPADDALAAWAEAEKVACHRGSEQDVLGRVVGAHRDMASDIVVEVTGDCALIDPEVVDWGIEMYLANPCDVAANVRIASFPMGIDVQVFRRADLEEVERTVSDPAVREHVSLFFYENPERYRILHLIAPPRWNDPSCRLQLDYPEDARFLSEICSRLEPAHGDAFGIEEITALLRSEPHLRSINAHCEERSAR